MAFEGFRQVGEFINYNKRRAIRQHKNPMDVCTIVSIYPRDILEVKHTIEPGKFLIPGGSLAEPSLTVIGGSSWWREINQDEPLLEIPVSSIQLAESIVNDTCNGMVACNMGSHMPGLFFVAGKIENRSELFLRFKDKLIEMDTKQKNWYQLLIRLADSMWARTNGNPLVIWDIMRLAARELGMDKAWLKDFQVTDLVKCAACGNMRNPLYPVCPTCRYIDPSHEMAGGEEGNEMKFARG